MSFCFKTPSHQVTELMSSEFLASQILKSSNPQSLNSSLSSACSKSVDEYHYEAD